MKTSFDHATEQWVKGCLAMIVGRLIYSGSKLSLSHRWKDTALWELCGVEGEVIERLKSVRREIMSVENAGCRVVSTPDEDQNRILDLLKVKL